MKQRGKAFVFRVRPAELNRMMAEARLLHEIAEKLGCLPDEVPYHVRRLLSERALREGRE